MILNSGELCSREEKQGRTGGILSGLRRGRGSG